mmetsp:Transcript_658/g.1532  ORF Transcript_658/g.1532 Transcript_658/m.1532 type:complete len:298 (-) Transcript_658:954-1847(-)
MGHQKSASTLAAYETRLVHMRGGGRREARELTVPSSECPTLDIGIESVCKIDTLFIRKGVQRWKDLRKVGQRTLNIAGEDGSLLIGQWIMWEGSKGFLKKLAMAADSNQMGAIHTILIHAGQWTLESCIVQSINGIAMEARERAMVELRSCTVGGGGEEEYLARTGLIAASHANVSMIGGSVVFCDAAGARVMDTGRLTLQGCRVCKNQIGISLQGECVLHVRDASLSNIVASLRIDEQSRYTAQVFMSGNQMEGTAWYGDRVPARQPSDPADQVGDEDWSDPDVVEHMQQGSRSFA